MGIDLGVCLVIHRLGCVWYARLSIDICSNMMEPSFINKLIIVINFHWLQNIYCFATIIARALDFFFLLPVVFFYIYIVCVENTLN